MTFKNISIKISEEQLKQIDDTAKVKAISRSQIIRDSIDKYHKEFYIEKFFHEKFLDINLLLNWQIEIISEIYRNTFTGNRDEYLESIERIKMRITNVTRKGDKQ